jgi:BASS family bile acid:Na+ symporter
VRSFEIKGKRTVETTSFSNFHGTVGVLGSLIFVITSLLGMGFSLTVQQILAPLSNRGDIAFSVGLMVLLMMATILYVPIVLPLLLSRGIINPWNIAKSLILLMLLLMVLTLSVRARCKGVSSWLLPLMAQVTNLSLLVFWWLFCFWPHLPKDFCSTVTSPIIL